MHRIALRLLPLALALLVASPAYAQQERDERARLHFESGRSYFAEGAYERALQEFEQAYALSPRTAMLFNVGTTLERLGLWERAADAFAQYLRETPDEPNRDTLERRVENLRARAARRDAPPDPTPDPTPGPTPARSSGGGDGLVLGGIVSLGVGGAALIAYAIFGGLTLAEQGRIEEGCGRTRTCTPAQVADMDTFALAADIMWPIGLAAAAAGGVLLALGLTSGGESGSASVGVAPSASASEAGVLVWGSF